MSRNDFVVARLVSDIERRFREFRVTLPWRKKLFFSCVRTDGVEFTGAGVAAAAWAVATAGAGAAAAAAAAAGGFETQGETAAFVDCHFCLAGVAGNDDDDDALFDDDVNFLTVLLTTVGAAAAAAAVE